MILMASPRRPSRARSLAFGVIGFAVTVSSGGEAVHSIRWAGEGSRPGARGEPAIAATTDVLSARELHTLVRRAWEHQYVMSALATFDGAADVIAPVAAAVERQAASAGMDPLLIVAVIAYENPELDPAALSPAGALGIMQVMPWWKRSFRSACGEDLAAVETNVCYGVRILQLHIDSAHGSVERGLLAYVGCVRRAACRRYPELVLRRRLALGRLVISAR